MLRNHPLPALRIAWTNGNGPVMGSVVAFIVSTQAGKSPISALRFVDLEYSSSRRRAFEIGMCDANGTMTFHCLTTSRPGMESVQAAEDVGVRAHILTVQCCSVCILAAESYVCLIPAFIHLQGTHSCRTDMSPFIVRWGIPSFWGVKRSSM